MGIRQKVLIFSLLRLDETSEVVTFLYKTEVIFVKDLLFAVLALVSAVISVVTFLQYRDTRNTTMIVIAVICIIATLGFGAMFLAGRVNKQEDIHITE